jgi:hypothetical protein
MTPSPRFIPDLIEVPAFSSIDEAQNFLKDISVRLGRGEIDSQSSRYLPVNAAFIRVSRLITSRLYPAVFGTVRSSGGSSDARG